MGANVVRRHATRRDPRGQFAQVSGSPIDSSRLSRTYRTLMACRRSGVRIPLAPLVYFPSSEAWSSADESIQGCPPNPALASKAACSCRSLEFFASCRDLLRSSQTHGSRQAADQGVSSADPWREPSGEPEREHRPVDLAGRQIIDVLPSRLIGRTSGDCLARQRPPPRLLRRWPSR